MKEEKIKVLALLPMELPKEIELDNTLEAMQKFVGGLIECITCAVCKGAVCNTRSCKLEFINACDLCTNHICVFITFGSTVTLSRNADTIKYAPINFAPASSIGKFRVSGSKDNH